MGQTNCLTKNCVANEQQTLEQNRRQPLSNAQQTKAWCAQHTDNLLFICCPYLLVLVLTLSQEEGLYLVILQDDGIFEGWQSSDVQFSDVYIN